MPNSPRCRPKSTAWVIEPMISKMFAASLALLPAAVVSAQPAPAVAVADYSTARVAPGSWSYQAAAGGSSARFVDSTGTARFVLECSTATRRVTISRTSAVAAQSLFLWTTDASRSLPARFEPAAMRVSAELGARDALLDAIAFSRGRIAVTLPGAGVGTGAEPLVMPAWPEAARTIEDCRF